MLESKILARLKSNVPSVKTTGTIDTDDKEIAWVSGDKFNTRWQRQLLIINGSEYSIDTITDDENLTLRASAGTQLGVVYEVNNVYGARASQGAAPPYLTVKEISLVRDYTHDGFSGLSKPRWQVSTFGNSYAQARQTAEEVITAMETWRADGVKFVPVQNRTDLPEDDVGIHHVPVDFFIHYEE